MRWFSKFCSQGNLCPRGAGILKNLFHSTFQCLSANTLHNKNKATIHRFIYVVLSTIFRPQKTLIRQSLSYMFAAHGIQVESHQTQDQTRAQETRLEGSRATGPSQKCGQRKYASTPPIQRQKILFILFCYLCKNVKVAEILSLDRYNL